MSVRQSTATFSPSGVSNVFRSLSTVTQLPDASWKTCGLTASKSSSFALVGACPLLCCVLRGVKAIPASSLPSASPAPEPKRAAIHSHGKNTESRTPIYHFITEICAIVGGAVTVRQPRPSSRPRASVPNHNKFY